MHREKMNTEPFLLEVVPLQKVEAGLSEAPQVAAVVVGCCGRALRSANWGLSGVSG